MSYDEAETIKLGELVASLHREVTGEPLGFGGIPHPEAIERAMRVVRERDAAITDLLNDQLA